MAKANPIKGRSANDPQGVFDGGASLAALLTALASGGGTKAAERYLDRRAGKPLSVIPVAHNHLDGSGKPVRWDLRFVNNHSAAITLMEFTIGEKGATGTLTEKTSGMTMGSGPSRPVASSGRRFAWDIPPEGERTFVLEVSSLKAKPAYITPSFTFCPLDAKKAQTVDQTLALPANM